LRGQDADLDENQRPYFRIAHGVFEGLFDTTDLVDLVVSGNSNAMLGESLLLLGEPGLPARAWEVR
jgi:hypothetical protein